MKCETCGEMAANQVVEVTSTGVRTRRLCDQCAAADSGVRRPGNLHMAHTQLPVNLQRCAQCDRPTAVVIGTTESARAGKRDFMVSNVLCASCALEAKLTFETPPEGSVAFIETAADCPA